MKSINYIVKTLENWEELVRFILREFPTKTIFLLYGNLGSGKTTLVQIFGNIMNVREHITSPTFSILHEYHFNHQKIYHFDLYRIKNFNELKEIGFEDFLFDNNYCLIEWPEMVENLLKSNPELKIKTLKIGININPENQYREVVIQTPE